MCLEYEFQNPYEVSSDVLLAACLIVSRLLFVCLHALFLFVFCVERSFLVPIVIQDLVLSYSSLIHILHADLSTSAHNLL